MGGGLLHLGKRDGTKMGKNFPQSLEEALRASPPVDSGHALFVVGHSRAESLLSDRDEVWPSPAPRCRRVFFEHAVE
jgi:hypothetical protein